MTVPYLAVTRNFVVTIAFSIGASRAPMPVRARHTIAIAYAIGFL